jgi:hypothetical protein
MRELELGRITRHFTPVCARRVAAQIIEMNGAEFFITHVIRADVHSVNGENHVLLCWHQWCISFCVRIMDSHLTFDVSFTVEVEEKKDKKE